MKHAKIILPLAALTLALAACEGAKVESKYPTSSSREKGDGGIYKEPETIFGDGKGIFSTRRDDNESNDNGGNIGVNTYLWRASLDTVSFMPIASADPFGGTILTDWYEDPATPGERFKLTVLILDRELKADGVRVRVFKQTGSGSTWKDAPASEEMARKLEDSILTRARQMRTKKLGPLD
jgi:hypothetical protein